MPLILSTKVTSSPSQCSSKYCLCSLINSCFSISCLARLLIKNPSAASVREPTLTFAFFSRLSAFSAVTCLILQSFSTLAFFSVDAVGYFANTSNTQKGTLFLQKQTISGNAL